jgi:propanol-preferring alcohol dehydrogenase
MGIDGGMASHVVVRDARYLVPVDGLDVVDAAPLADAALAPYHAIRSTSVPPGSVAVVIGAGGLGHVAVQLLAGVFATTVVAVEPDSARCGLAADLGATLALHPDDDVAAHVRSLSFEGAAAVFDFVGSDETLALAGSLVAPLGSVVLLGTALGSLPFGLATVPPECRLHTSVGGETWELAEVVALARAGRFEVRTRRVPLDDVVGALQDLAHGGPGVGRTVAVPNGPTGPTPVARP